MDKYFIKIVLISAIIITFSCGGANENMFNDDSPAISVEVAKVGSGDKAQFFPASGKVMASNSTDLATRIMGFVERINVSVGDKVRKGEVLLSINYSDLQAKLAQAKAGILEATASYTNAEKDYQRFKNLFASNSATQKELDDMAANFETAKARLEAARQIQNEVNAQFSYAEIRAPFNGVVTNKFIEKGDIANPGIPLLSMESPSTFEVFASVPESAIARIKSGSEVEVIIKSINEQVKGIVSEVSTSARNTGGQYEVKVELIEKPADLRSGMFATVHLHMEEEITTPMIMVPEQAIVYRGQLTGIYTVSQSNTAILRWLRLGKAQEDTVEVLSGLAPGEEYIISSNGKLYNGAKISIQKNKN